MPGIPSRPDLSFDLFDALGLNPITSTITPSSVQKAWRHVNLHLHPDKILSATHVPAFPTHVQARQAKDYLLAEEKGATDAQSCIRTAIASGKHSYRSTWNPWATPNTEAVLKPIPGARTVASQALAVSKSDWEYLETQDGSNHVYSASCPCGSCQGKRWADEYRAERYKQQRAYQERMRAEAEKQAQAEAEKQAYSEFISERQCSACRAERAKTNERDRGTADGESESERPHTPSCDCKCGSCSGRRWAEEYRAEQTGPRGASDERTRAEADEQARRDIDNGDKCTCNSCRFKRQYEHPCKCAMCLRDPYCQCPKCRRRREHRWECQCRMCHLRRKHHSQCDCPSCCRFRVAALRLLGDECVRDADAGGVVAAEKAEKAAEAAERARKHREWFDGVWDDLENLGDEGEGQDWFVPRYDNHQRDCDCAACEEWKTGGAKEKVWREYNGWE